MTPTTNGQAVAQCLRANRPSLQTAGFMLYSNDWQRLHSDRNRHPGATAGQWRWGWNRCCRAEDESGLMMVSVWGPAAPAHSSHVTQVQSGQTGSIGRTSKEQAWWKRISCACWGSRTLFTHKFWPNQNLQAESLQSGGDIKVIYHLKSSF